MFSFSFMRKWLNHLTCHINFMYCSSWESHFLLYFALSSHEEERNCMPLFLVFIAVKFLRTYVSVTVVVEYIFSSPLCHYRVFVIMPMIEFLKPRLRRISNYHKGYRLINGRTKIWNKVFWLQSLQMFLKWSLLTTEKIRGKLP